MSELSELYPKEDHSNVVLLPSGKECVVTAVPIKKLGSYLRLLLSISQGTKAGKKLYEILDENQEALTSCLIASVSGIDPESLDVNDAPILLQFFMEKNMSPVTVKNWAALANTVAQVLPGVSGKS